eukprot:scaffold133_cov103-Isochrysis_galbana.AAC.3
MLQTSIVKIRRLPRSSARVICRPTSRAMGNKWIEEELEPGLRVNYRLSRLLDTKESKWQTVDLVRASRRAGGAAGMCMRCATGAALLLVMCRRLDLKRSAWLLHRSSDVRLGLLCPSASSVGSNIPMLLRIPVPPSSACRCSGGPGALRPHAADRRPDPVVPVRRICLPRVPGAPGAPRPPKPTLRLHRRRRRGLHRARGEAVA